MNCGICNEPTDLWEQNGVLCEECADKPRYRYYSTLRPPGLFAVPDGSILRKIWDKRGRIHSSRIWAHGWVEYAEPLPFGKVYHYDLLPADDAEIVKYAEWCKKNT